MDTVLEIFAKYSPYILMGIASVIVIALVILKGKSDLKIYKQVENLEVWIPESGDNLSHLVEKPASISKKQSDRRAASSTLRPNRSQLNRTGVSESVSGKNSKQHSQDISS
ncbi:MAG: hypothetical protein HGA72_07430 [Chlorobiaceae bacterium]|nr:hypothetical protein [Chlorobiaceae bacterium]NTW64088.1 hypothetical protein [Chlorobiaceae bacterium]HWR00813.1 hypothetical protein [Chlorobaculum sp.]